ncbi:hypothetical protein AVEN_249000-1 [Araneus ventricosus]|uniref:Tc1-like transposase DDE domain-containing protein n=1 Tax=Araneus ventricosus TaxID=182803 RepID=A0A4Y2G8D7_ARAVE|nr:hypothetical protein AVEN_249000-1 [Araneus ventricosus]
MNRMHQSRRNCTFKQTLRCNSHYTGYVTCRESKNRQHNQEHRAAAAGVGIVTPEIQINTSSVCDTGNCQNIITANTTTVRNWKDQAFPGRWNEHSVSIECPIRCPDLTPPEFFLWDYLKDKIYSRKVSNL